MSKRIYVDMDDTLCDFTSAKDSCLRKTPEIKYPWCQMDFFRKLNPIDGAIEAMRILDESFEVLILTRPSIPNPLCYTEKRIWVEENLGIEWCERLIICPDKSLVIGDYLIDDQVWPGFIGKQLVFASTEYPDWDSILRYFKK